MKYNLIGKKYGKLTVIECMGKDKNKNMLWKCKCECGNYKTTISTRLTQGECKSCGCLHKQGNNTKHKLSDSRLYNIWHGMIERCYLQSSHSYYNYGGRGIKVCERWKSKDTGFINFYNWAIKNGYNESLTLDRINNAGNYTPKNCRWVDMVTQANNKRTNVVIEYNGESKTLKEWSRELGMSYNCLGRRIRKGWYIKEAFETPERKPIFDR